MHVNHLHTQMSVTHPVNTPRNLTSMLFNLIYSSQLYSESYIHHPDPTCEYHSKESHSLVTIYSSSMQKGLLDGFGYGRYFALQDCNKGSHACGAL